MKLGDFLISEVIFQFGFILEKCARCSSEVNSWGIVILNTFFKDGTKLKIPSDIMHMMSWSTLNEISLKQ